MALESADRDASVATLEALLRKTLATLPEEKLAVELLWSRDLLSRWRLDASVIVREPPQGPPYGSRVLMSVGLNGDLVRVLALAVQRVAETGGLDFFYSSPDEPDDRCPDWIKRRAAMLCIQCAKLVLDGVLCSSCERWLRAIARPVMRTEAVRLGGVVWAIFMRGARAVGVEALFPLALDGGFAAEVDAILRRRIPPRPLSCELDLDLGSAELVALRAWRARVRPTGLIADALATANRISLPPLAELRTN